MSYGFRCHCYLAIRKPQTGKIRAMSHDWLLVETLGGEPVVVADGRQTKNLVPISVFLRRSPDLMAIQTAISETVRAAVRVANARWTGIDVARFCDGHGCSASSALHVDGFIALLDLDRLDAVRPAGWSTR